MKKNIKDFVTSAVDGDKDAFEKLYNMTKDKAYFIALSITHNEDDAMDILHDSYIKALENLKKLEKPENFEKWFNQIIANTAKTYIVKRKPMIFEDDNGEDFVWQEEDKSGFIPHRSLDIKETKRMIMDIIDRLPEDKRLCVLLYYYEDIDVEQIAKSLDISEGTVKSRLFYARKTIADEIESLEENGIKLYSAGKIPLIAWTLKNCVKDEMSRRTSVVLFKDIVSSAKEAGFITKSGFFSAAGGHHSAEGVKAKAVGAKAGGSKVAGGTKGTAAGAKSIGASSKSASGVAAVGSKAVVTAVIAGSLLVGCIAGVVVMANNDSTLSGTDSNVAEESSDKSAVDTVQKNMAADSNGDAAVNDEIAEQVGQSDNKYPGTGNYQRNSTPESPTD